MLYIISATEITLKDLVDKCQFCHKRESLADTKTCGLCRRRLALKSRNIWTGVPKRQVWRPDDEDYPYPLGIFDYNRLDSSPRNLYFEDDPGGSFDNARRAREDGR